MGSSSHGYTSTKMFILSNFIFMNVIQSMNCFISNYSSEYISNNTAPVPEALILEGDIILPPLERNSLTTIENLGNEIDSNWTGNFLENTLNDSATVPEALIFEGDIILPSLERNALATVRNWENGIVPYVFERYADRHFQSQVRHAMYTFYKLTDGCIRFVPRTFQRDFIVIKSYSNKCFSTAGRYGGPQFIHLGPGCRQQGTILHELFHALGFLHEQSRTDRDNYIIVLYQNIIGGLSSQFNINYDTVTFGVPYDYESIVHYRQYDFSRNGRPTIITKDRRYQNIIGTAQTLSEKDILKIKRKYNCYHNTNEKKYIFNHL